MRFVVWVLEPAPHNFFGIVSPVKSGLVRLVGISKLRVKKNFSEMTGALEAFVAAIEIHQDQNRDAARERPVGNPYLNSIIDVIPRVSMCFDSGLANRYPYAFQLIPRPKANFAKSSTDFPVSNADDRRLFVNTSGDTSLDI